MLAWYNWLIVILPFSCVLYMAFHMRKYIRSIPDFLAGGRICGRYLLSVGSMEAGLSVMALIAYVEVHYRSGFFLRFLDRIYGTGFLGAFPDGIRHLPAA